MTNEAHLAQLLLQAMETYGAAVQFAHQPPAAPDLWARHLRPAPDPLAEVAACLARDTSDFDCIDELIALLAAHGYAAGPRHDFG